MRLPTASKVLFVCAGLALVVASIGAPGALPNVPHLQQVLSYCAGFLVGIGTAAEIRRLEH